MNVFKYIVVISALATAPAVHAYDDDDDGQRHRVGMGLEVVDDYYGVGLSYHRMICPYIGVGGSIGMWSEISAGGLLDDLIYDNPWYDYGYDYGYYEDCSDNDVALYIEPSIVLRTPPLFRIGECRFGLTAMPSVRFSTNYYCYTTCPAGNDSWNDLEYKCRPISYGLNASLSMRVSMIDFSVGYRISSLDVNRNYTSSYRFTREPVMGVFLEIAGYF